MFRHMLVSSIALASLTATVSAQTPAPPAAASQAPPPHCSLPEIAASTNLHQIPGSDLVTVPVQIDGKPRNFLLAVGTNVSDVSQTAAAELKLVEGIKRTETFQSGPANWPDDTSLRNQIQGATLQSTFVDVKGVHAEEDGRAHVIIPAFTIGGATGRNLGFAVASETEIPKSAPYDGRMTGSFFKQYDVELDFAAMKLTYLTPTTCTDPHRIVFWPHKEVAVIPMTLVNGKMGVQVEVAGHRIDAVLDTASARTIMRRDIAENTVGLKAGSPQMPPAGDMRDGEDMQVYTATFPQIAFAGGVTAFNVPALIQVNSMTRNPHKEAELYSRAQFKNTPLIPPLTLGMDVLRQLHLYIVYGQNSIYMTSAE